MSTSEKLNTAHNEWNRLYGAYTHQYAFIQTVGRNVTDMLGLDGTKSYLEKVQRQSVTGLNPYFNEAFSDIIADKQGFNRILDEAAKQELFKIQNYIDATSIVFMHSILEASLIDLLKITLALSRDKWMKYIDQKSVTFSIIKAEGLELPQNRALQKCFKQLKNDPIMKKCERIFEICGETDTKSIMPSYRYDNTKLEKIDNLRHDIVHGLKIEESVEEIEEHIEYLRLTGLYFFYLIRHTYKIDVIMEQVKKSLLQQ